MSVQANKVRRAPQIVRTLLLLLTILNLAVPTRAEDDRFSRFIAETKPLSPMEQQKQFHLPAGFTIELVAAEPKIRKPINLNFDAGGRLLVSGSVEYPFRVEAGGKPRDTIKRLTDTNGDGRYDKVETLADGLNIPVGVTATPKGFVAYSIPSIKHFSRDKATQAVPLRRTLFAGFDSADTHGMPSSFTPWLDGWIYGCQGESNSATVKIGNGQTVTLQGGATFRFRPDGSQFETFAVGQVNPFGLCFDPLGNLYSADSHSRPAYLLLQGARYPGLTSSDDGLGFGPEMMRHRHSSTGIAGIAYYAADQFPPEYRDTLFLGNPVTGRVNHNKLERQGSSVEAIEQPDFLTCDDPWFRPVDIQLGPDGALYIADFYNRVIAHSLVPLGHAERDRQRGRIWRVVYTGDKQTTVRPAIPDLTKATVDQLIHSLGNPNLLLRTLATHQLVERIGRAAIGPLQKMMRSQESQSHQRAHGLWALERLGALDAKLVRKLATDPAAIVRVHLMKVIAERADWGNGELNLGDIVRHKLADGNPFVRRAAAEALGRHADSANIVPLLEVWEKTPADDSLLIHTIRIALRNNLRDPNFFALAAQFVSDRPDDASRLANICLGLPTEFSAEFLLRQVQEQREKLPQLTQSLQHAARYVPKDSLPKVNAFALSFRGTKPSLERNVLRSLYRGLRERNVKPSAKIADWAMATAGELIRSDEEPEVFVGIELAWDLKLTKHGGELAKLAAKSSPQPSLRTFAIDALAAVDAKRAYRELGKIMADISEPTPMRQKAADSLGKINSERSRQILVQHLPIAPAPVATIIAQQLAHSKEGTALLMNSVAGGKASARLLQDAVVEQRVQSFRVPKIDERLTRLTKDLPAQQSDAARLIFQRRRGFSSAETDLRQGARMFIQHCSNCHQLSGTGKRVGPDLDGIGLRGADRLLEDLLDPNRNVANAYRRSIVTLKSGRVLTGLVTEEKGNRLVLVDAEAKPIQLSTSEIDVRRRSPLSPMPGNVSEKLSAAELYDLLRFLLEQKEKPRDR